MARNEEKAMTLWNRWQDFQRDYHSSASNKRPLVAAECNSLQDAVRWRRELLQDITKKVSSIQNGSLGEHRIREMNDDINKLMRQKYFWETRVRELGGVVMEGRQFYDVDGQELPGAPGYKYYGAAKQLPGVRELFAEREDELKFRQQKRTRADMYKNVTPDYYGYRDDDDGILAEKEAARESELVKRAMEDYTGLKASIIKKMKSSDVRLSNEELAIVEALSDDEEVVALESHQSESSGADSKQQQYFGSSGLSDASIRTPLHVPAQQDINSLLLAQKRQALLDKIGAL